MKMRLMDIVPVTPQYNTTTAPHVGVYLSPTFIYGRETCRGVLRYALEHPNWRLYLRLFPDIPDAEQSPELNGAIVTLSNEAALKAISGKNHPMVNISGRCGSTAIPRVTVNNTEAGKIAGLHLIEKGFTRIAFFSTHENDFLLKSRLQGLTQACENHHLSPPDVFCTNGRQDYWDDFCAWLINLPKPIAIAGESDFEAYLIHLACSSKHLKIPGDVGIIGFNNEDFLCFATKPPLTSVELPFEEVGYRAAELLDRMMAGEDVMHQQILLSPLRVVQRGSTDILITDDERLSKALRILRERAYEACSVAEIAAAAGINRRTLEIKLQALLGRSPHEELMRLRMEKACLLLETSHLPIDQIANMSGYPYTQNFNRVFRQVHGMTAGQYRAEHKRHFSEDT